MVSLMLRSPERQKRPESAEVRSEFAAEIDPLLPFQNQVLLEMHVVASENQVNELAECEILRTVPKVLRHNHASTLH